MNKQIKSKKSLDLCKWELESLIEGFTIHKTTIESIERILERNEELEEALTKFYEASRELGKVL